jgi:hypothetical protein
MIFRNRKKISQNILIFHMKTYYDNITITIDYENHKIINN